MYRQIATGILLGGVGLLVSSCGSLTGRTDKPAEYKITEDGGAYVSDVSSYESLGIKSAARGQKYKITDLAGGTTPPHFLVVNITQYYGNKKGDEADGAMLFIKDGSSSYDCKKYLSDIKISVSNDDIPNVTCKFEVVGNLALASKAALKNGD
jgi:hypothetical protein